MGKKRCLPCVQDEYGAKDYSKILVLKDDHQSRPLWIVSSADCDTVTMMTIELLANVTLPSANVQIFLTLLNYLVHLKGCD